MPARSDPQPPGLGKSMVQILELLVEIPATSPGERDVDRLSLAGTCTAAAASAPRTAGQPPRGPRPARGVPDDP